MSKPNSLQLREVLKRFRLDTVADQELQDADKLLAENAHIEEAEAAINALFEEAIGKDENKYTTIQPVTPLFARNELRQQARSRWYKENK